LIQAQPPENPSEDFEPIEQEDLLPGETLSINLTDSAIKVRPLALSAIFHGPGLIIPENGLQQIERAQQAKKDTNLSLRLLVESGGCHGYQYKMAVTSLREPDD